MTPRAFLRAAATCLAAILLLAHHPTPQPAAFAQEKAEAVSVPYIFWGGDVATFQANGGLETRAGSLFAKSGLNLKLTDGNDFDKQVADYLANKSPFLRGTVSMLAQKCDVLGKDPKTKPVVFLQLTWSAGDHLVSREPLKTLADLKGKKIALQKGGPHVGMLDDVLWTARIPWKDVTVVWTDDVTGEKGPAALFRKDNSVDACFAITPDMMGLTGGLDKTGDGAKDSVKGAHVLVSTADMKRSIADVYACRKDFYDAHKDVIEKFTAGYLKACEEIVEAKKEQKKDGKSDKYQAVLKLTRDVFGKDVPTDDDAAGLLEDAVFVGLPGNVGFFTDKGNLSGFDAKQASALDLAVAEGGAKARVELLKADLDYAKLKKDGGLTGQSPPEERFRNNVKLLPENALFSFNISFEPNQSDFSEEKYSKDFDRAVRLASLFGNAVIAVRGHADPSNMIGEFLVGAEKKKLLTRKGDDYLLADGTKLDLKDTKKVLELIDKNDLHGNDFDLKDLVKQLGSLSETRAETVRGAVVKFAGSKKFRLDRSQIKAQGVGAAEPAAPYPKTNDERAANRRVEFRLVRVPVEGLIESDFDY
jgi:outer membrane protein OmpA-like peptidoglycan-associated protein